jgi:flagellum-specific peptidoglycan hydrolase FlgJ
VATNVNGYTRKQFIDKYYSFINKNTRGTGLLPELVICQAILESSGKVNGIQLVGGSTLSRRANNYFGIKCSSNWHGKCYSIKTKEHQKDGSEYYPVQPFRIYPSVEASILDHIKLLTDSARYKKILTKSTPEEQFYAVQAAGYATATTYAPLLMGVYKNVKPYIDEAKKKVPGIE